MIREYDEAVVAALGATVVSGTYKCTVPNASVAVPVYTGLPEDWFGKYTLPIISITRAGPIPDPVRRLPNFVAQELSTTLLNTFNIQKYPPQPVKFLYTVTLASENMHDRVALMEYLAFRLPSSGYGTSLTVGPNEVNYRQTAYRDRTPKTTDMGRVFVDEYDFSLDAWLTSTECIKVGQIGSIDLTLEIHKTGENLQVNPPQPEPEDPLDIEDIPIG